MNFLAHLYLSGSDHGLIVGNLLGDFVKGRLRGDYPVAIERGIELHRRIDSFSSLNTHFLLSKRRIDPSFGHYRGVMVDLFYDHFLSKQWSDYSDIGFNMFISNTRMIVEEYRNFLPERLKPLIPYIFSELLPSYREIAGISRALVRMSARLKRINRLGDGGVELEGNYNELRGDFHQFFPQLSDFVAVWKENISAL